MQCPLCKTEMEKGLLSNLGTWWAHWPKWFILVKAHVVAWKCSKCGKIELSFEP